MTEWWKGENEKESVGNMHIGLEAVFTNCVTGLIKFSEFAFSLVKEA